MCSLLPTSRTEVGSSYSSMSLFEVLLRVVLFLSKFPVFGNLLCSVRLKQYIHEVLGSNFLLLPE